MKKTDYSAPVIEIFRTEADILTSSPVGGNDLKDNWMPDIFDLV